MALKMSAKLPFPQPPDNKKARPPLVGKEESTISLVSRIKKLITTARIKAAESEERGDDSSVTELVIASAIASDKLRSVIDGKVNRWFTNERRELLEGIRVLEDALKGKGSI